MAKWDHLIESSMPFYGGWDEGGEMPGSNTYIRNSTEFELVASSIIDPLRCLLGSVSRSAGSKQHLEIDHIEEEMGLIEKAVFRESFAKYAANLTNGHYKNNNPEKTIAKLKELMPKLKKHGELMLGKHRQFFPDDAIRTDIAKQAFTLLVKLSESLLSSISTYPEKVEDPYPSLKGQVRRLSNSVAKLLKLLKTN